MNYSKRKVLSQIFEGMALPGKPVFRGNNAALLFEDCHLCANLQRGKYKEDQVAALNFGILPKKIFDDQVGTHGAKAPGYVLCLPQFQFRISPSGKEFDYWWPNSELEDKDIVKLAAKNTWKEKISKVAGINNFIIRMKSLPHGGCYQEYRDCLLGSYASNQTGEAG